MSLDFTIYERGNITGNYYELFSGNSTHNVSEMWKLAGIYDELYNSSGKNPKDIVEQLNNGFEYMRREPDEFKKLNPSNKWGDYKTAIEFLTKVVMACYKYPGAEISISK